MKSTQDVVHSYLSDYCSRGWRVFPASADKEPLLKGWPEKASTDLMTVNQWWNEFPSANIGIATGSASGFWVLDIDMKNRS